MKSFLALVSFLVATFMYAQEVSVSNEKVQFSKGTFDAIVVSIPFATKEDVLKSLKDEMKAWGGKVSESNDEFESVNAQMKKMGEQYFNGYSKVIKDGDVIKVAFIVDLGGAYMNKMEHGSQYDYIEQRAKDFGVSASKGSIKITNVPTYERQYLVDKFVNGITLKYGYTYLFNKRIYLDIYVGAGVRIINRTTSLTEIEENNIKHSGDGSITPSLINAQGTVPVLNAGIKLGFRII